MGKMLALRLIIVLALASVAGYLFLTEQVCASQIKIRLDHPVFHHSPISFCVREPNQNSTRLNI